MVTASQAQAVLRKEAAKKAKDLGIWSADDICRLIDHAKEKGVRFLRVGDLEFTFEKAKEVDQRSVR